MKAVFVVLSIVAFAALGVGENVVQGQGGSGATLGPNASPTAQPGDPRWSRPCNETWMGGESEGERLGGLSLREGVVQNLTATVDERPLARWEGDTERGPVVTLSWAISAADVLCVQIHRNSPAPPGSPASDDVFNNGSMINLATETSFTDDGPFNAGRHCYRVVPIGENGPLEFVETCVDVSQSTTPEWSPVCAESWRGGELETEHLRERGVSLREGVVQNLTAVVGEEPLARFDRDTERGPFVEIHWKLSTSDVLCVQVLRKGPVGADAATWESGLYDDGETLAHPSGTSFTDRGPFDVGRSCYRIVPINEKGPLEFAETCVDVPTARGGFAPYTGAGSPAASDQPAALPTVGNAGGSSGGGFPWWPLGLAVVPLAALAGYVLMRRRSA